MLCEFISSEYFLSTTTRMENVDDLDSRIMLSLTNFTSQPAFQEANQGDYIAKLHQGVRVLMAEAAMVMTMRPRMTGSATGRTQSHNFSQSGTIDGWALLFYVHAFASLCSSSCFVDCLLPLLISSARGRCLCDGLDDWRVDLLLQRSFPTPIGTRTVYGTERLVV
jgi:hypothetical protein